MHVSSDAVFSGTAASHDETYPPDPTLPAGLRAAANLPGPIDVRLDCTNTQARLNTRLRGAREFLAPTPT